VVETKKNTRNPAILFFTIGGKWMQDREEILEMKEGGAYYV
jgi:hypothetical protein